MVDIVRLSFSDWNRKNIRWIQRSSGWLSHNIHLRADNFRRENLCSHQRHHRQCLSLEFHRTSLSSAGNNKNELTFNCKINFTRELWTHCVSLHRIGIYANSIHWWFYPSLSSNSWLRIFPLGVPVDFHSQNKWQELQRLLNWLRLFSHLVCVHHLISSLVSDEWKVIHGPHEWSLEIAT